mgnify:FL=1
MVACREPPQLLREGMASQIAGGVSTLLFYPLDTLKTRCIASDGTVQRQHRSADAFRASTPSPTSPLALRSPANYYSVNATSSASSSVAVVRGLRVIHEEEGIRGLFRGAGITVFASSTSWGLYMLLYRRLSTLLEPSSTSNKLRGGAGEEGLPLRPSSWWDRGGFFARSAGASVVANSAVVVATNPLWLLKTRLQLSETPLKSTPPVSAANTSTIPSPHRIGGGSSHRSSLWHLTRAVQLEGMPVLWRGTGAQLLASGPASLSFPIYDSLRAWRLEYYDRRRARTSDAPEGASGCRSSRRQPLPFLDVCLCSGAAKVITGILTHPLLVVKVRLQDASARLPGSITATTSLTQAAAPLAGHAPIVYTSLTQAAALIWRREGIRGFAAGLSVSLMQVVPRSVVQVVVFERLSART